MVTNPGGGPMFGTHLLTPTAPGPADRDQSQLTEAPCPS